jgi:SAM-dependent methyltransferase
VPSYRESHLGKGADYHAVFGANPRRILIWQIEQALIDRAVRRFLPGRPIDHLDFACGTGRILALLEDRTRSSTGVDVSPSMLATARGNVKRARLVRADLTRGDPLGTRTFDLITAFRFFPNAERQLRREAMAALTRRLAPGGILLFNNHINHSGLSRRLARVIRGGGAGHHAMSHAEVAELVDASGLQIRARYHTGFVPETEARPLRPRWLIAALERAATHLPLAALSDDVLYVCTRTDATGKDGG